MSPEVNQINMSEGATEVGRNIFTLHMMILGICTVIGIGVFGVMFYSIIYHRKSRGVKPATFHESTTIEIAWTVVPFLILIGMAVPATSTELISSALPTNRSNPSTSSSRLTFKPRD